jgi:hypothetical protein
MNRRSIWLAVAGALVSLFLAIPSQALAATPLTSALAGHKGAPPASKVTDSGTPPASVHIHPVNLHASYKALLGREHHEPKADTAPSTTSRGSTTASSCSEPNCPMQYGGGSVQHSPRLYLLLWGPSWSSTGSDTTYLHNFLAGLGVQPSDNWSTIMNQYTDTTGHPAFSGSVLWGVYQDSTTPPSGATQSQLAAEADAFYQSQGLTDRVNTQIIVATPSGTCPSGFYSPNCSGGSGSYCAWHSDTSVNSVPYTNLPYMPDAGSGCGEGRVNSPGTYDGYSIVEGHEYAETVTDPFPYSGWWDSLDSGGGEIGDKCAWRNTADVTFSTGTFAMQPLWSNSANLCVMSSSGPVNYTLSVSKSGTGTGTVSSSPAGINCGATCSASYGSGTSVTLTATPDSTSTFAGWGGACTGTSTCTVNMNASQNVTATFSTVPSTTYQESDPAVSWKGWHGVTDSTANGGTYRSSNTYGDFATFKFSGTSISWLTRKGPSQGIAKVYIDNVLQPSVDLYATSTSNYTKTYTGLSSTTHTIKVVDTNTKNASSTGYNLALDGFQVGTTITQDGSGKISYDYWTGGNSVNASGGAYRTTTSANQFASLTFTGTSVDWITATGPSAGKADVTIDGVDKGIVDLYASTQHWSVARSYTGLSSGSHTIKVTALGTKNTASTSTKVIVDAFTVHS